MVPRLHLLCPACCPAGVAECGPLVCLEHPRACLPGLPQGCRGDQLARLPLRLGSLVAIRHQSRRDCQVVRKERHRGRR